MFMELGSVMQQEGKLTEAEATLREGLAMQQELLPKNHADMLLSVIDLAGVLEQQGKLDEAVALYRQAANAGNGSAQARLGRLYANRRGMPKDVGRSGEMVSAGDREQFDLMRTMGMRWSMIRLEPPAGHLPLIDRGITGMVSTSGGLCGKGGCGHRPEIPGCTRSAGCGLRRNRTVDRPFPKEAMAALTAEQDKKPLESRLKLYEAKTLCRDSETFYGDKHSNQP